MQIPNPFKILDHGLIDYVFNPIAWESELKFGKDAVDLAIYVLYLGMAIMLFGAIMTRHGLLLGLVCIVIIGNIRHAKQYRGAYNRHVKTGLNVLREWWLVRFGLLGLFIFVGIFTAHIAEPSEEWYVDTGVFIGYLGYMFWYFPSFYFLSTDKLPPGYGQSVPEAV